MSERGNINDNELHEVDFHGFDVSLLENSNDVANNEIPGGDIVPPVQLKSLKRQGIKQ